MFTRVTINLQPRHDAHVLLCINWVTFQELAVLHGWPGTVLTSPCEKLASIMEYPLRSTPGCQLQDSAYARGPDTCAFGMEPARTGGPPASGSALTTMIAWPGVT